MKTKLPIAKSMMIAASLLPMSIMLVPGAIAADQCEDGANINNDMNCNFSCLQGETVSVTVRGNGYGWGSAECNGASAGCDDVGLCTDTGVDDFATSTGSGDCDANMDDGDLLCTSQAGSSTASFMLLHLLLSASSCEAIESVALTTGTFSYSYKRFEDGLVTWQTAWNAAEGC